MSSDGPSSFGGHLTASNLSIEVSKLPFLWGTATSAYQVEGENRASDWWAWEQAGKVKDASGIACDHYRRFHEDFDLISRLGHTAHRFSLEWSRLEPEENRWDDAAVRHYEEVLKELRARQIEPIVTLHHFTNPAWFTDQGGWLREDAVPIFIRYVKKTLKAFSPYVRYWITINEPLVYLYHAFFAGLWPPGICSYPQSLLVFRHLLKAHILAYQAIHRHYEETQKSPVYVSLAHHMTYFMPCRRNSLADRWSVFLRNYFFNYLFFDAALSGFLFFPGMFCERLPGAKALDFLGVNYYSRDFIQFAGFFQANSIGIICEKGHHPLEVRELNAMAWDVYPEGLYQLLKGLKRYRLPVFITENGICAAEDSQRIRFIKSHLETLARAGREGLPLLGYLYWSLLDNFEWAHGYGPRFGIVEVNYETQQRKVRESAQVLSETCRKLFGGGS